MLEAGVELVVGLVRDWGYVGIFLMMLIESSFIPFPSEVALIPAGYLASQGEMSGTLAVVAGVAGSVAGALLNYGLAAWLGRSFLTWLERFGRVLALAPNSLAAAERYFERHGEITTFVGRLIPGIRQLISIPAGLARMRLGRFVGYTALGAGLWSSLLVVIGYLAGQSEALWRPMLRHATGWMFGGVILLIVLYLWYPHRGRRSS